MNIEEYINKEVYKEACSKMPLVNEYKEELLKDFVNFVIKYFPKDVNLTESLITLNFCIYINGFNTPYFLNSNTGKKMIEKFNNFTSENKNLN